MKNQYYFLLLCALLPLAAFAQSGPTTAPPTPPARDSADVISLFSDAYDDVSVDTYLTPWSVGGLIDTTIAGNAVKRYTNLDFAGIETTNDNALNLIAAGITHLHVDFWSANSTSFAVKLVDFGGDGFGMGNDTEFQIPMDLARGEWVSLDYPLDNFTGLNRADISQFIISSMPAGESDVYLDNIYFYNDGNGTVATGPTVAAPTPTRDAENVVSLFSDAYDDVAVNTFLTSWSEGFLTDTMIAGDSVKLYRDLNFAGIETTNENALDLAAAGVTHLHIDFWSANSTAFRVKLVDFGGDGFGNGTDTEFEITRTPPQGQWVGLDYPLSAFTGLNLEDISQFIIGSMPAGASDVYLDNIYFYVDPTAGTQPDLPVTFDEEGVDYSLQDFGGAASMLVPDPTDSTNTVVATTKTAGAQTFAGTTITADAGGSPNDPGFASPIVFTVDATTISVRVWSPNAGIPVLLKVENSADATVSVETLTSTTVAMAWDTLVFDFANEAPGTAALNLASTYNKLSIFFNFGTQPDTAATYYWDDVIFSGGDGGGGGANEPMVAAPTPTRDSAGVLSLFSDAYNDVPVDTWRTPWSVATLTDLAIQGNAAKRYTNLDFAGIETTGANALNLDSTGMTDLHVDYWTPNMDTFRIKLVDFGGDGFQGGNDTEAELAFPTTRGTWVGLDIPLTDFAGMNRTDISQFIISGLPAGAGTVYLDNVYFFNRTTGTRTPVVGRVEVYPNPVVGRVSLVAPARMSKLQLFSLTGQLVGDWQVSGLRHEIDLSGLAAGTYVALLQTADGPLTVRLVKQ